MEKVSANVTQRVPCLDGLRAISIIMVLFAHMAGTRNFDLSEPLSQFVKNLGNLGVRVFFVISGYLITSMLLAEYEKNGCISLKKFYFNRTFRIFPAMYVFVLFIVVANYFGVVTLYDNDILFAASYTMNYHDKHAWEMGHLWSLAVEEQFYLLWPLMFVLFGKRGAFFAAIACLFISPIARVITWKFFSDTGNGHTFETVADTISTGCLMAFLFSYLDKNTFFNTINRKAFSIIILLSGILILNNMRGSISVMYPIGESIINVLVAILIYCCIKNADGKIGYFLNSKIMVSIGLISYSLYLWQQPLLNRNSSNLLNSFPINIFLTFLVAVVSYFIVEKPFLQLRSKIAKRLFVKAPFSGASGAVPVE
jgi:peptidoglycan/LPS O-acetylase OafA/YrhL